MKLLFSIKSSMGKLLVVVCNVRFIHMMDHHGTPSNDQNPKSGRIISVDALFRRAGGGTTTIKAPVCIIGGKPSPSYRKVKKELCGSKTLARPKKCRTFWPPTVSHSPEKHK